MGLLDAAERAVGSSLPDEGWTCDHCDHHNDDIYGDVCENCDRNRNEEDEDE